MNRLTRVHADNSHEVLDRVGATDVGYVEPAMGRPMLLRIPEVAAELGLGRSSVYQLIQAGELPVVHIGRSVRVARADLVAWVDEQRQTQR